MAQVFNYQTSINEHCLLMVIIIVHCFGFLQQSSWKRLGACYSFRRQMTMASRCEHTASLHWKQMTERGSSWRAFQLWKPVPKEVPSLKLWDLLQFFLLTCWNGTEADSVHMATHVFVWCWQAEQKAQASLTKLTGAFAVGLSLGRNRQPRASTVLRLFG